jgi:hypothetical protein
MRGFAKTAALFSMVGWLVLAGAAVASAESSNYQDDPPRVSFIGIDDHGRAKEHQHFSPADLSTLVVAVSWRSLAGAHAQRVELVTPDGSVYQRLTTDVTNVYGRARIETPVRVGGTWITEYQIFGHWTVNVYLDDHATPVATAHFTLLH